MRPKYPRRIFFDDFLDTFRRQGGWTPHVSCLAAHHIGRFVVPQDGITPIVPAAGIAPG